MAETAQDIVLEQEWHRKFAVGLNHLVWELLQKAERTQEEDGRMVHAAHASSYHWDQLEAVVRTRGEWLISHVYAVLNRPESALYHAQRCFVLCQEANVKDFDVAYGYEAMARAFAVTGQRDECSKYLQLAQEAGEKIANDEDHSIFDGDFNGGPWYGMR